MSCGRERPEGDGLKHWFEAAAEIQSTKINGGQQDVAVVAQPNEPAVVAKVKRAPKSTTVKQSESTKPLKKTIAPKKSGGKKGKRPEAQ
ncbi:hypothetical protein [Ensifer sp. BR816]|uniref:hypothetical protein n=1 Tax=Rhizobium sp. (strain BR816) TaxID=1057002 RepID=UPI000373DE36|nr:hypothetical protein [Ensifer sp. BR816]